MAKKSERPPIRKLNEAFKANAYGRVWKETVEIQGWGFIDVLSRKPLPGQGEGDQEDEGEPDE